MGLLLVDGSYEASLLDGAAETVGYQLLAQPTSLDTGRGTRIGVRIGRCRCSDSGVGGWIAAKR